MEIAALVPYSTNFCSGQRFRIELWARCLERRGIKIVFYPFASPLLTKVLYRQGLRMRKAAIVMQCYVHQLLRILRAPRPDLVYIYREAALIGPAVIERLARRWRVPIVYDLDEPLFIPYVSPRNKGYSLLKCPSKTHAIFQMCNHTLAVNRPIADYARRFTPNVSIVPMAVDTDRYYPSSFPVANSIPRVGWVGTLTSQQNLDCIAEPVARLQRACSSAFRVVADEPVALQGVKTEFIQWDVDLEVPALQQCEIGIVPVKPNAWSPHKFYFKLIQFMSLGLPVVATPTGSNTEIIQDGVNGFFAETEAEWYERLWVLTKDPALRLAMGRAARNTVVGQYSLTNQIDLIEELFRKTAV